MSSNFWLDNEDEWDDDIYSSDSGDDRDDVKPVSKFADLELDDDDEDDKRVTRSAHEKSWDELSKSTKLIKNKMNINDWNAVSDGTFERRKTLFSDFAFKNIQFLASTASFRSQTPWNRLILARRMPSTSY